MIGARYSGLTRLVEPLLSGEGAILMLHRVGKPVNKSGLNGFLSVEGGFLNQLLEELKRTRIRFVSMDEAVDRIKAGHSDEKYASVTLDDGYRDNALTAAPIFNKHEVPYTIYACTGFLENSAFLWWEILAAIIDRNDRISFVSDQGPQALDCRTGAEKESAYGILTTYLSTEVDEVSQRRFVRDLAATYGIDPDAHCRKAVMSWAELKKLEEDPLCCVGAHTVNHYHLARLSYEDALGECEQSSRLLEQKLGKKPKHFAYPYGGAIAAGVREAQIAREAGFESAVTTRHGLIHPEHRDHLHALPRISINGEYQQVHYVKTLLSGITVPAANRGRKVVTF